jgi:predicted component of type VI protein secretion system
MTDPTLPELLASLHERLKASGAPDSQTRQLLQAALQDIEGTLNRGDTAAQPMIERLEELAVSFEAEHPTLVVALRRFTDALGKAGI